MPDSTSITDRTLRLTSETIYRIFLKALLAHLGELALEERATIASARDLVAFMESNTDAGEVHDKLQSGRWDFHLDLEAVLDDSDHAEEIMRILDEAFPNPQGDIWNMETLCRYFSITYSPDAEGWQQLIAAIDEKSQQMRLLSNRAAELSSQLDETRKDMESARLEAAAAQEKAERMQRLMEASEKQRIAAEKASQRHVQTGYESAVLRSIARKCDIDHPDTLDQDELVQQICDVLDSRLVPKGMRLVRKGKN